MIGLLEKATVWTASCALVAAALIWAYVDWWDRRLP